MALFEKKKATLYDLHADAAALGDRALGLFHSVAADLRTAAEQHARVADEAQAKIDDLAALRNAASGASKDKLRQAEAVAALVA